MRHRRFRSALAWRFRSDTAKTADVDALWEFIELHRVAPIDVDRYADAAEVVVGVRPPAELLEFLDRSGTVTCEENPWDVVEIHPLELLDRDGRRGRVQQAFTSPLFPLGAWQCLGSTYAIAEPDGCRVVLVGPSENDRPEVRRGTLVEALAELQRLGPRHECPLTEALS